MKRKVTEFRHLVGLERRDAADEQASARFYEAYALETEQPVLEQTPRARAIREISRITTYYGWGLEVARYLDACAAASVPDLSDGHLFDLADRLLRFEECLHAGLGSPDAPPAY